MVGSLVLLHTKRQVIMVLLKAITSDNNMVCGLVFFIILIIIWGNYLVPVRWDSQVVTGKVEQKEITCKRWTQNPGHCYGPSPLCTLDTNSTRQAIENPRWSIVNNMWVFRKDEWQGGVIKTSRQDVGSRKRIWSQFKVPEG